jgi:putative tryptophan/tyrosine transport system substrate-binding protein
MKKWMHFLVLLCIAMGSVHAAAIAQQTNKDPRIGFLWGGIAEAAALRVNAFLEGVRGTLGSEASHIELVSRVADGDPARLPTLAAEIAAGKVDVLFAAGPAAIRAAREVAPNLPIVGLDLETDPVEAGLVSSLSRPSGNLTGVFFDFPDFGAKWLQLLRDAAPTVSRIAVFWDPSTGALQLKAVEAVAGSMGVQLRVIEVKDTGNIDEAFRTAAKANMEALLVLSSPIFGSSTASLAERALRGRLPAITLFPEFAQTGGLLAYGPNLIDLFRQSGTMTGKVLAGTRPGDLPIERPARFQLIVNLRTARTLGLDIPASLLIRADQVIE